MIWRGRRKRKRRIIAMRTARSLIGTALICLPSQCHGRNERLFGKAGPCSYRAITQFPHILKHEKFHVSGHTQSSHCVTSLCATPQILRALLKSSRSVRALSFATPHESIKTLSIRDLSSSSNNTSIATKAKRLHPVPFRYIASLIDDFDGNAKS